MIFVPVPEEANYETNKTFKGLSPHRSADSAAMISVRRGQFGIRRFRRDIVLVNLHGYAIRYNFFPMGSPKCRG